MKLFFRPLFYISLIWGILTACSDEPDTKELSSIPPTEEPTYTRPVPNDTIGDPSDTSKYKDNPLWQRHKDSSLKILAIGNSYTDNSTMYFPWLINQLNGDSICIMMIKQSGCSLKQHWESHTDNKAEYYASYSDKGGWVASDIKTIDEALDILDWDIITIQQFSGYAGLYQTFQPYLSNLLGLFRATNPNAQLAWHSTWANTTACKGYDFIHSFDSNPEKMYNAIMSVSDRIAKDFDIQILSTILIKRLREEFPEVEDGFSSDGSHITDAFARYALASLWYDMLVAPQCATSRSSLSAHPGGVDTSGLDKMEKIIKAIQVVADVPQITVDD